MLKEKGKCPCAESQTEAGNPVGGAIEISPEAYQLLRNVTTPSAFKEAVREVIPNMTVPYPTVLESPATLPEIDMTSMGMPLRVPAPPLEMSIASLSVSQTDVSALFGGRVFYLADLTLNLSGVAQMTPGLLELARCRLAQLMVCRDDEEGDEDDEEKAMQNKAGEFVDEFMKGKGAVEVTKTFRTSGVSAVDENRNLNIIGDSHGETPKIQISVSKNKCKKFCWVTVMRYVFYYVSADGTLKPVMEKMDFKKISKKTEDETFGEYLKDGPAHREEMNKRQTKDGFVVDGYSNPGGRNPICSLDKNQNFFQDAPLFHDSLFTGNQVLLIREFETCVRCEDPIGDYFACFKWYSVKVKGQNDRVYFETWPPLFEIESQFQNDLDKKHFSKDLRQAFEDNGQPLSEKVQIVPKDGKWLIWDGKAGRIYSAEKVGDKLRINPYQPETKGAPSENFKKAVENWQKVD